MDGMRFDTWTKTIAQRTSRRSLMASFGRGMVGILAGSTALRRAPAKADDGLRLDVLACLGLTPRLAAQVRVALNLPHVADTACVDGRCAIVACDSGWADCDGRVENGCETELGTNENCASCGDGCARLDDACNAGACADGACVAQPANEGSVCDDGNACTLSATCQSGICFGSAVIECPPPDQCHLPGFCDPATGACLPNPVAPDGTVCGDDGDRVCRDGDCVLPVCAPIGEDCQTIDDCCVGWCDNESLTCAYGSIGNTCRTDLDCFEGFCIDEVCSL